MEQIIIYQEEDGGFTLHNENREWIGDAQNLQDTIALAKEFAEANGLQYVQIDIFSLD